MDNNNENCPVIDIMGCVDAHKEKLGDGVYMQLCNIILRIKKHHELLTKDVRRLKKKMFQSKLISDCVIDYITDREYDSDDEDIFLHFAHQP